jgi:uncharacterized membrane protein required for colicin V production
VSLIVDGILAGLILLFALLGLRRGLFRSLAHLVGAVASLTLSLAVSRYAAEWVFQSWIRPSLLETVTGALEESGAKTVSGVMEALPDSLSSMWSWTGESTQTLEAAVNVSADKAADVIVSVLSPVILNLLMAGMTLVLFLLLMIVVRLVVRVLNRMVQLPVLRQINGLLGFCFGMGKGILIVWLLCLLVSVLLPLWSEGNWLQPLCSGSYLYQILTKVQPFTL